MTPENAPSNGPTHEHETRGWVLLGVVLIVAGFFLGAQNLGLIPMPVRVLWDAILSARFGIGVLLIGVLLIIWAQSGHRFEAPARGVKLYRSRSDKWIAGVLGGLAEYFKLDATLLRLAVIGLVVLLNMGALIVVYIVMAIVVPLEPEQPPVATAVPPVPPAPPTAPTL